MVPCETTDLGDKGLARNGVPRGRPLRKAVLGMAQSGHTHALGSSSQPRPPPSRSRS
eukprot:CAMPEP_0204373766 /NCGR_PEP_ID=MMETSP0469-20131031/48272_1 /ASSEMBLY_ACC=CAM_ASM_000384 /TAXON_ID=2969 /ORGANISM="Oxyrrhis marina" /LENGTH=56 /DNA_ID=CAMNT_0051364287 /DNA_START=9 /DNA_END=179 /DNA_ORIENTATION=+